jgi:hypothetical protein
MYCKSKAARIRMRLSAVMSALEQFHMALLDRAAASGAQQQLQLGALIDNLGSMAKVHTYP